MAAALPMWSSAWQSAQADPPGKPVADDALAISTRQLWQECGAQAPLSAAAHQDGSSRRSEAEHSPVDGMVVTWHSAPPTL